MDWERILILPITLVILFLFWPFVWSLRRKREVSYSKLVKLQMESKEGWAFPLINNGGVWVACLCWLFTAMSFYFFVTPDLPVEEEQFILLDWFWIIGFVMGFVSLWYTPYLKVMGDYIIYQPLLSKYLHWTRFCKKISYEEIGNFQTSPTRAEYGAEPYKIILTLKNLEKISIPLILVGAAITCPLIEHLKAKV